MAEESLRVCQFEEIPSPREFISQIESRNIPAVFKGCVKNWKAFSLWDPSSGGLDYLLERVGSSMVDAMLSRSAPVFYGDIRGHERVQLPFSTFIGYCNENIQKPRRDCEVSSESERHELEGSDTKQGSMLFGDALQQIYLAQVPIMSIENEERVQLGTLREDIQRPAFLETKELASINLWMNNAHSRSSTHYDPHQNVLCVVAGCKQVVLWPPSASPFLYPMPLYGEASNHSAVNLEKPDLSIHPRAEQSMEYSQKVILHAGDALFIPEGWFHQVDSEDLTIAVNFWWRSDLMSGMSEHMDAYYLRLLLRRLTDKQMNRVLGKSIAGASTSERHTIEQHNNGQADYCYNGSDKNCAPEDSKANVIREKLMLHELEPPTLKALQELVSLVHDRVNVADQSERVDSTSTKGSAFREKHEHVNCMKANLSCLENDPVACVLSNLHPLALQNVFLAMAHNFPRTLEALMLHLLSPVAAEVLTRKFDEMDQLTPEEDRNKFYEVFYGAFDDQCAAMDTILSGKECFARQAFQNVLDQYLGICFDGPKPSV
ncbi:lysine-specific demethylase JMJ31 isoform X2 [Rhododendron vialii]|uniref:lysine-specific demethylase JMJ31 isoform X2 n=1 Tax=Rhododendron vialii TaxID=182163 RepID=UPI0026602C26|nr:lysine-specific demethylase JMJ31 isoform X2 [Rhododendron vialii]